MITKWTLGYQCSKNLRKINKSSILKKKLKGAVIARRQMHFGKYKNKI